VAVREKIIVIALPGIGDALMSTPMFRLLRDAKPEAEIHALVMFPATRDLFRSNANIDHVHYFDFINTSKLEGVLYLFHLRQEGFDISINIYPQNRWQYNIFALLLGAARKLGIRYKLRDWRNLSWLCTDTFGEDDSLHCVEENVRLLRLIGIEHELDEAVLPSLDIHLKSEYEQFASQWLKEHRLEDKHPLVGFHAGTALFKNHIMRRWAPEKFAQLARKLKEELGAIVLLFGGPDDVSANETIMQLAGDAVIEVRTKSIMESIAIMKHVDVFVSNDSALMHIAGGLGLKTVAIFGPTNETYVHPWKTDYQIIHTGIECRPCFRYSTRPLMCFRNDPAEHYLCVRAIEVDTVFQAAKKYAKAS